MPAHNAGGSTPHASACSITLYAHARGWPRSLPCLVDGEPAPYDVPDQSGVPASCTTPNPSFNPLEFHVPTSSSGYSDLPGGNAMVTLGLWDQFVARPFVRAGTTFHELGHNLQLWHGGSPAIWGNKVLNTRITSNRTANRTTSVP